jgi:NADH-quinone oxidoreductase subunit E
MFDIVLQIIERNKYEEHALISILQDLQTEFNWLPKESLEYVAEKLNIPVSRIYALATFYKAFSLKPKGKHILTCCLGTACHVRGAARIVDKLKRELKVEPGETTPDMQFTLETVNCVGACALGPIVICDGEYHGHMTNIKIDKMLRQIRSKDKPEKEGIRELVGVGSSK